VGGEAVDALVADRAVVRNIPVDGVEIDVRRIDAIQKDAAVGGFRRQIAGDIGETDALS
jgi:hypothetical protein